MLLGKRAARFALLFGFLLALPLLPGDAAADPGSTPPAQPPDVQPAVPGGFSMVLASDSQYKWWRGGQDPICNTSPCIDGKAAETNLDMALGIANITQIGPWPAPLTGDVTAPTAVIINGDLTEYWHPGQIDAVQAMYALQPNPIYYGLGNHDYQNNTTANDGSCYSSHGGVATTDANRCAKQAIAWMADKIGTLGVVNHDAPRFVSMYNDASYIAELVVVRFCDGVFTIYNDAGIGAGNTGTVLIPPCTGTEFATMSFKTVFNTYGPHPVDSFKTNPGTCFRLTGVISNPSASRTGCADARNLPPGGSGSMSYSWNVGNYHFVQLHNFPGYQVDLPAGGTAPVLDANAFSVTQSYAWLSADLAAAHAAGKHSVLLFHDAQYFGGPVADAISGKNVVAIFGGHIHNKAGQVQTISNGVRQIPVFFSGSAECRSLIYAEFQPHKFNVGLIDVTNARLGTPPRFNTRARCDERDIWEATTTANYYRSWFSELPQLGEFGVGNSPDIKVTPTSLDYDKVTVGTTSATQQVTVRNTGPTGLNVGALSITGAHAAQFVKSADTCSSVTVAAGAQCTVRVAFAPTGTGARTAPLVIPSNDPDENPVNVALTGAGVIPDINVTPNSLAFGNRAVGIPSPTQQVTVQNTSTGNLLVAAVSITGPHAADFLKSADTCSSQTVAPFTQCTLSVAFAPAALGPRTATLVIPSNDPDENPVNVALTGAGVPTGGKNLTITTGSIALSWDGGTAQTAYTLLKYNTSTAAATLIPVAGNATIYSDNAAANDIVYCYVLAALNGPTLLGLSDLLCGMTGPALGPVVPQAFALKLGGTANATMTWAAPVGGADSYLLQRIPLDGSPITTVPLGGGATTTTEAVTAAGTCFQLLAFKGAAFGNSNVLCGVPGVSTLAALPAGAGRTAADALAEVIERLDDIRQIAMQP